MAENDKVLEQIVLTRVLRLNAKVQGIACGLLVGLGIFVATNWLIIKGGPVGEDGELLIGPHLSLLNQFMIGYRVTFVGSLIGFAYGFLGGFLSGYCVASIYNRIVGLRDRLPTA
jgi:hypothetical protein